MTENISDRHYLGGLCRRGHSFSGQSLSLRKKSDRVCVKCALENARARYKLDPLTHRKKTRERHANSNGTYTEKNSARAKRRRSENRDAYNEYARNYYKKNSIKIRLRNRLCTAIRQQNIKKIKTFAEYGIDHVAIIEHLGPCPGDLKMYDIDHIKPLSSFDLSDLEQIKVAFSPENHQWLTKKDNMAKSKKLDWKPSDAQGS